MSSVPREHVSHDDPTPQALRRLLAIGVTFAAVALLTYALPSERLRPWVSGEGMPIARMYTDDHQEDAVPGFAEAGPQLASGATAGGSDGSGAGEPATGQDRARAA